MRVSYCVSPGSYLCESLTVCRPGVTCASVLLCVARELPVRVSYCVSPGSYLCECLTVCRPGVTCASVLLCVARELPVLGSVVVAVNSSDIVETYQNITVIDSFEFQRINNEDINTGSRRMA